MGWNFNTDIDQQEAIQYRAGQRVQLKQRPGVIDIIAEYNPMMVPPISLVNDSKPRYPEELEIIAKPAMHVGWFKSVGRGKVRASVAQSRSRTRETAIV